MILALVMGIVGWGATSMWDVVERVFALDVPGNVVEAVVALVFLLVAMLGMVLALAFGVVVVLKWGVGPLVKLWQESRGRTD